MGIQINGQTDTISASDGGLAVSGYELTGASNINVTGIITTSQLNVGTGGTVITTTASGNINIDSGGVYYDASNNRLAVGTTTPGSALEVKPSASLSTIGIQAGTINSDSIRFQAGGTVNTYLEYRGYLGHAWFVDSTERMRIESGGDLLLGSTPPSSNGRLTIKPVSNNNAIAVRNTGSTADHWTLYISSNAGTGGWNGAATINYCAKDTGTNRSINAAGTVNASGADYAEYMFKAGSFDIAKGDICGVDGSGMLTNIFADAVGFVVKSTNPSYVGGDTWGNPDAIGERPGKNEDGEVDQQALAIWEAALETERQKVDRIAFSGQVPVNVTGTTPGQYIVPAETADGGIEGVAKNEADLTLAEYIRAIGKVIAIEDDGRARIIVKVA